jgi:hypothetical protein
MSGIILDLDNCISDDINRRHFLNNRFWLKEEGLRHYHANSFLDRFVGIPIEYGDKIIIFTGRPDRYRDMTISWLNKNGIKPILILMRPDKNYDKSPLLKEEMLAYVLDVIEAKEIKMAYDDRQDVLDMYKKYDIPTTLKRINDYENR